MTPVGNCPGCGGDEPFEQIHLNGCPDAAGGDCAEWVCTGCGAGVIMGTAPSAGAADAGAARQRARAA
jgi:hypothetical protein